MQKDVTRKGVLKLFIGAAPGVGKTYTMLREAKFLLERGNDVVIGFIETHQREETYRQLDGLEMIPPLQIKVGQSIYKEVDLQAILRRRPEFVIIDELAHSNAPGSIFSKRYQDVEFLLDNGISVLTAVNVQHIEGIHKEAEQITGIKVRELIPESFVRRAEEVSLIDVTPETLRQRLRDGSIYPKDQIQQALQHFFKKENLSGLRELALRTVADDVEERLEKSYSRQKIPGPVGVREVIMVCVSHYQRAILLIQRGQRMAIRLKADFYVLAIADTAEDLLSDKEKKEMEKIRQLAEENGAEWLVESKNDRPIGEVILKMADRYKVTQIVLGQPAPSRQRLLQWQWHQPVRYLLRKLRYTDLRIVGWRDLTPGEVAARYSASNRIARSRNLYGNLTIYIGAAPGVGKTYRMLQDAHDWKAKNKDVVIGLIETHGREDTRQQIGNLEVIPQQIIRYEGRGYPELDVQAILKRRPEIVLIDELAHSNIPGSIHKKRYQDILYILEHGIDVVTAVNIQHLESLKDSVEHITGVKVRERIPDWFMKLATEIKLIDVTPETLQQRLMEGRIYHIDKIESAIQHFFQSTNLAALRELALLEVADDVDQKLHAKQDRHQIRAMESESILVCVNYRSHSEKLIRRGWRVADRLEAKLYVLVVQTSETLSDKEQADFQNIQSLAEQFSATFLIRHSLPKKVGTTIVEIAKALGVSQLVMGQPIRREYGLARWKRSPIDDILDHAEFVDLHIVSYTQGTPEKK
ncbi:histidine kinase [Alicyclobacillus tolerans]|uniref:Two-component system, OmpR family, sensor histidine kinase KdpD n=1 Tax=Alicyclobacillus tolerans TaxID=90970 RepID=A0A1M6QNV7_9BACL|nr:histidine kinase [Alicyclobacillus montanus]SHK21697.1 two-component system, OmpR family, sensor histidine kinase KdpD [Alicyclobacillus montanus]